MTPPEQSPDQADPDPLPPDILVEIAKNSEKGSDFTASVTSFIRAGMSPDRALAMLGLKASEAKAMYSDIQKQQTELLRKNTRRLHTIGTMVLRNLDTISPLHRSKKK